MSQRWIMTVSTECEPGREDDFNRWYDEVHLPQVLSVAGIVAAERYVVEKAKESGNRWFAVYQLDREPDDVRAGLGKVAFDVPPYYLRSQTVSKFYRAL